MTSATTLSIDEIRDNNARIVFAWHLANQACQSKNQELFTLRMAAAGAAAKLSQLLNQQDPSWPDIREQYEAIEHRRMQSIVNELYAATEPLHDAAEKMREANIPT